jgi:hypothetical protein
MRLFSDQIIAQINLRNHVKTETWPSIPCYRIIVLLPSFGDPGHVAGRHEAAQRGVALGVMSFSHRSIRALSQAIPVGRKSAGRSGGI